MHQVIIDLKSLLKSLPSAEITKKYSYEEIESFEKKHQLKLLDAYKDFLIEVGSFKFSDEYLIFEIVKLENIESWSEQVFQTYQNLFPKVLLVAHSSSGEEFGFINEQENLFVFNPDCPCDLWEEEQLKSYDFLAWLKILVETKLQTLW